jgi:urease accessory protein
MGWSGRLQLHARHEGGRTIVRDRHEGPMRVLASLHPEGPAVCHQVLVHPPGGLVGGDQLDLELAVQTGAHLLLTTPGATRLYRSTGERAEQRVTARLEPGARLEWLPLETIVYPGARSSTRLRFDLAPGALMIGLDVLALGLPASDQPFHHGEHRQHLEIPGVWRERALLDAGDRRWFESPLGWGGRCVLATAWVAAGDPFDESLGTRLADAARDRVADSALAAATGVTRPDARLVVTRVLADRVEPAFALLQQVWQAWRPLALGLPPCPPRVWRT